jgi:hypothetical protein
MLYEPSFQIPAHTDAKAGIRLGLKNINIEHNRPQIFTANTYQINRVRQSRMTAGFTRQSLFTRRTIPKKILSI